MPPQNSVDISAPKPKPSRVIIVGALIMVATTLVFFASKKEQPAPVITQDPSLRIEFGSKMPTDFPINIPVEEGAAVDQSYSLDYKGEKQLTIVFSSTKAIKQNYTLYADFLKNDGWIISNTHESKQVASLYGTKGQNDINVTISTAQVGTATKTQVSISVLKK